MLNGLIIPDCDLMQNEINKAIIRASKEVQSGSKIIKMIFKQHYVTNVAFSGEGWFDRRGNILFHTKPKESYKYKIEYDNCIDGKECIWCFN